MKHVRSGAGRGSYGDAWLPIRARTVAAAWLRMEIEIEGDDATRLPRLGGSR